MCPISKKVGFLKKESRPPLKLKNTRGLLSATFLKKKHFLIVDFQKMSPSSEMVGFSKKWQKVDPL